MKKPYKIKHGKPRIKLLVFGRPGIGKTELAGKAQDSPDMADVLFINIEGGLLTINNGNVSAIDVGKKDDGASNGDIVGDIEKIIWAIATKQAGFDTIQTIVIDSASELQTRDLEDIVVKAGKHDVDVRHQNDYGLNTARLKRIFRSLKDLNVNVIFTAIEKVTMNESNTKIIEVAPALTDKVKEALMGYVDMVWYYYKDDAGKRWLMTDEKGPYRAKTRNSLFQTTIGPKIEVPPGSSKLAELYATLVKVINAES